MDRDFQEYNITDAKNFPAVDSCDTNQSNLPHFIVRGLLLNGPSTQCAA